MFYGNHAILVNFIFGNGLFGIEYAYMTTEHGNGIRQGSKVNKAMP